MAGGIKSNKNMENSNISWTDNTFSGWVGCTEVSPGCSHCYARFLVEIRRGRAKWGNQHPRIRQNEQYWEKPLHWNKQAEKDGRRIKVFSASLSDVFDPMVEAAWLDDLFALIRRTPHLDWQLLTKRPQLALAYSKKIEWPENAWIGTSIENQQYAYRAQIIAKILAPVRFLSVEPLLESVKLDLNGIDWAIIGGESGPYYRGMQKAWVLDIQRQCREAEVPFFFKQWSGVRPKQNGHELNGVEYHEFPTPKLRTPAVREVTAMSPNGAIDLGLDVPCAGLAAVTVQP